MSTRAEILAQIASLLPDNNTRAISPADLRAVVNSLANSYNNSTDEGTPAQAQAAAEADATAKVNAHATAADAHADIRADIEALSVSASPYLPVTIPNQQIVCMGDSLTAGLTSPNTTNYPWALAQVQPLVGSATPSTNGGQTAITTGIGAITVVAGYGAYTADILAGYTASVYPKRPAATGSSRSVLLLWVGANDYPVLATTPASWIAAVEAAVATAKADGFAVGCFTVMDRLGSNNVQYEKKAARLEYNRLMRNSKAWDFLVDADALFPDPSDTTWFLSDGSHLNDDGNTRLAKYIASILLGYSNPIPSKPTIPTISPVVSQAQEALLNQVSLVAKAASVGTITETTAIGSGDFTLSSWFKIPANANGQYDILNKSGDIEWGVTGTSAREEFRMFLSPADTSAYSSYVIRRGIWNHLAVTRSGSTLTYYCNGVACGTDTSDNTYSGLTRLGLGICSIARTRAYSRCLSAAEILAEFNNLSTFNVSEANHIFALADGNKCAGLQVQDLSSGNFHVMLPTNGNIVIAAPARVGVWSRLAVGNTSFSAVQQLPANAIVLSWDAICTTGGLSLNLGSTNGGGQYNPTANVPVAGHNALPLPNPLTGAGVVYQNTTDTVTHNVVFTTF